MLQILLIEDDKNVADFIINGFEQRQHNVDHAFDGQRGLVFSKTGNYDALIVDRMLPGIDGTEFIKQVREQNDFTPALILSALAQVEDRIEGLKAGADDYLVKPFDFEELYIRIESLIRRKKLDNNTALTIGDLTIDLITNDVTRGGKKIILQPREFKLLEYLMQNSGQIVTREMLLENVWDYNFDPQTNIIDVHVSRLRQKIDKGFDKSMIKTVRGAGYMIQG